MKEIENKIELLIAAHGNDELMSAWLEYLEQKNKETEKFTDRLNKKDPVIIGALIGGMIGSLFEE